MLCLVRHDTSLLVLSYSLLKEISFPLERNVLHKVKWILNIINLQEGNENHVITVMDKLAWLILY